MMAIRTTTTRTTTTGCAQSAGLYEAHYADFSFADLVQAYFDCRASKRNSDSALAFEINLERNLAELDAELRSGEYQPGKSICFVVTHPKPREVWAAMFGDRIVHHLLYNHISPAIHARFIADSCACIPERGTLYGAKRLEKKARSITQNWNLPAYYLKADLANFFVSIDKHVVGQLLEKHITEPWWLQLARQILFHDPRDNYELRGHPSLIDLVPEHKRLVNQSKDFGLPIGNLSSQFFANLYLNELDQFIKHELRCKHYVRYVDDFVLLHESAHWLHCALQDIQKFLAEKLNARLNPKKTIVQPVHRGIDFVGQVILPHRRVTRRKTVRHALKQISESPEVGFRETANSYFGLIRQASHSRNAQVKLSRAVLRRGKSVNYQMTKTY